MSVAVNGERPCDVNYRRYFNFSGENDFSARRRCVIGNSLSEKSISVALKPDRDRSEAKGEIFRRRVRLARMASYRDDCVTRGVGDLNALFLFAISNRERTSSTDVPL